MLQRHPVLITLLLAASALALSSCSSGRAGGGEAPAATATVSAEDVSFDPALTYAAMCAQCHGERRYGGYSPPLTPETLKRKTDEELVRAIRDGLPNTQMPAFGEGLDEEKAKALVALFREPLDDIRWSLDEIRASRLEEEPREGRIPESVRRENLVLLVERGTGEVVVLDGDAMTELDRFPVGRIHGGIKFDREYQQALAVTRDGTLVDYDLDRGAPRTRVKVGVNTRNIAVSTEGELVVAANQLPQGLVVMDGRLNATAVFPLPGQPSAVYQVPRSKRFLVTLRDNPRLFFLEYPELKLTEVELDEPFEDFLFVPGGPRIVASSRSGKRLLLYDYDANEVLGALDTVGLPHLFSASFFDHGGRLHAAFNHVGVPRLSIVDMEAFEVTKQLELSGAGYFTRTHEGTPYLWIDTNTESIVLVNKQDLTIVPTVLTPAPGKKAMHVEFTAEGDRAMVSVWDQDGAMVVYDSNSLAETLRQPYAMPIGKYNALNKTRDLR